jgi:hypothetical protein
VRVIVSSGHYYPAPCIELSWLMSQSKAVVRVDKEQSSSNARLLGDVAVEHGVAAFAILQQSMFKCAVQPKPE